MEINESKNNSRVNPVSNLQEICAKNGFSLPLYEILDQLGPPHDPIFWITCKILAHNEDICAKGSARTKQVAKRIAAQEVLNILYQKDFISVTKKVFLFFDFLIID
jgi:dsRNA-specific ribonuclease